MEKTRKQIVEEATEAGKQDLKNYYRPLKLVPLILVYQIWVVAILQAFGWLAALPACAVTVCWLVGWPQGMLKNIGLFLLLGLLLPILIGA